jgi:hypothetical protein
MIGVVVGIVVIAPAASQGKSGGRGHDADGARELQRKEVIAAGAGSRSRTML